ncbi:cryptochrome/photolyase family protein [Agromyces binzhouensis]|uniref:Cryptochrome/photolyase family protein n=1 Tax=Agromyces binzhouensis TaxID=1817495 RepID=A0A4Q2JIH0_9MICO|nr:cryptochrome/photolyase family protein [Agromyces binzhouensis]RXZ46299.1 cryptochrome/photolyase family protein [Agromyces binzhouensis]
MTVRWLFAGQLGSSFDDGGPILLVEARAAFGRAPMHRQKAHLVLSAIRHRAAELGARAEFRQVERFGDAVDGRDDLEVIAPPSRAARSAVQRRGIPMLPSRGFTTTEADFAEWMSGRGSRRTRMEDFYGWVRERTGLLMRGPDPEGGRLNLDRENRRPPPRGAVTLGLPEPWWPDEDDIDREVRADLDRWEADGSVRLIGADGPRRFAVTEAEAERAVDDFIESRLGDFGPFEDAVLEHDWVMAHSLLSVPLNLGLLDPLRLARRVATEYDAGRAPLSSVEGFVRQVVGWRDWVWHLYWHLGPDYVRESDFLGADRPVPRPFAMLDPDGVDAACLRATLADVRDRGWAHHIQRLMVLGNWALQRGVEPAALSDWFAGAFVDGTPWVMPANVVGMSQHADGGRVATKPYAAGGAYLDRMTDYCGGCRFDPRVRTGPEACPFTAGYWAFLDRAESKLRGNHRMAQPLAGLRRLSDRAEVVAQERARDEDSDGFGPAPT